MDIARNANTNHPQLNLTMPMKNITTIILLAFCMCIVACTKTNRTNHVVAIDNSQSVPEKTIMEYIIMIERIIVKMGGEDMLTVLVVDGCSQSQAERIFSLDMAKMDFTNREDGINNSADSVNQRRQRFKAAQLIEFRKVIMSKRAERKQCRRLTDIIGSLFAVEKLVYNRGSYSSDREQVLNTLMGEENFQYSNSLYILSDMIHEGSDGLNFELFAWKGEADVLAIATNLQQTNKVPSLTNVDVFVSGATSSPYAGAYGNQQIKNVTLFWTKFIKDSGANLKAYGYDTRLEIERYLDETQN
jgi:hypothetical protein